MELDYSLLSRAASGVGPGADGVVFMPFLDGTRRRPELTAAFRGLRSRHGFAHLTRAIMEGVVFELRALYELFRSPDDHLLTGAGGGLASAVWRQIAADIFGLPLRTTVYQEQAALGAALVAGVAVGTYDDIPSACRLVRFDPQVAQPDKTAQGVYARLWEETYRRLMD